MKKFALALAVLLATRICGATSITGNVSLAMVVEHYNSTEIVFMNPAIVLPNSTGDFAPLSLHPINILDTIVFTSASGMQMFAGISPLDISMDILTLTVVNNSGNFLNIVGTANMEAPGFTNTFYDFTMTATRPDGVTSGTMTAIPAVVPEPTSLFLVGTGLLFCAGATRRRSRG